MRNLLAAGIVICTTGAASAQLADVADYEQSAVKWAYWLGIVAACDGPSQTDVIEAEAIAGAEVVAPGMWAWVTGARSETAAKLFDMMHRSYVAAQIGADCGASSQDARDKEVRVSRLVVEGRRIQIADE